MLAPGQSRKPIAVIARNQPWAEKADSKVVGLPKEVVSSFIGFLFLILTL